MADNKTFKLIEKCFKARNLQEFFTLYFNTAVEVLNESLQRLSITRNFDGQVFDDITIPNATTVRLIHKLGLIPKYRVILRKTGQGLIQDGTFTKDYVEFYNHGPSQVIVSLVLLKE